MHKKKSYTAPHQKRKRFHATSIHSWRSLAIRDDNEQDDDEHYQNAKLMNQPSEMSNSYDSQLATFFFIFPSYIFLLFIFILFSYVHPSVQTIMDDYKLIYSFIVRIG